MGRFIKIWSYYPIGFPQKAPDLIYFTCLYPLADFQREREKERERGPGRSVPSGSVDAVEIKFRSLLKSRDFIKTSDSPAVKGQIISGFHSTSGTALRDLIPWRS